MAHARAAAEEAAFWQPVAAWLQYTADCEDLYTWNEWGWLMMYIALVQAEIIQDPAAFVELDPEMAYTLLDLKRAVSRAPSRLSSQISQHCCSFHWLLID